MQTDLRRAKMDENILNAFKKSAESMQILRRFEKPLMEKTLANIDLADKARISIGIAGAQGVGKTTLLKAILASTDLPDPPFPARQREETGVPVFAARSETPHLIEVYGKHKRKKVDLNIITQNDIHIRTSADTFTQRHADYLRLKSLEVFMPDLAIPEGIFLVDLPGVGGNLATVSKWARKYVLEGMNCILFVLDCAQAVTCVESEANLIRMFGPQLFGSLFIQNVWSEHEDDVESVEKANREFLSEHIGDHQYVKIDLKQALQEKAYGNPNRLASVLHLINSLGARKDAVFVGTASRALKIRGLEIRRALEMDLRRLMDQKGQYQEEKKAAEKRLKELEEVKQSLLASLEKSSKQQENSISKGVKKASEEFLQAMQEYIDRSESLNKQLIERKLAREVGSVNKKVATAVEKAIGKVHEEVGESIRDYQRVTEEFAGTKTPDIDGNPIVIIFRKGLPIVGTLGGAALGAKIGGIAGTIGGPIGAIVGGLLGAALGSLLGKIFMSEKKKRRKCLEQIQTQVQESIPKWVNGALVSYRAVIESIRSAYEEDFQLRAKKVVIPQRPAGADGIASVRKDIKSLDLELKMLDGFLERL